MTGQLHSDAAMSAPPVLAVQTRQRLTAAGLARDPALARIRAWNEHVSRCSCSLWGACSWPTCPVHAPRENGGSAG